MSPQDEKAADLVEVLTEIGECVTWKGRRFRALVSEPTISEDLNLGGFIPTGDFTIKILRSDFRGDQPALGDQIGYEGDNYRVSRLTNHPLYPMLVLVVHPED